MSTYCYSKTSLLRIHSAYWNTLRILCHMKSQSPSETSTLASALTSPSMALKVYLHCLCMNIIIKKFTSPESLNVFLKSPDTSIEREAVPRLFEACIIDFDICNEIYQRSKSQWRFKFWLLDKTLFFVLKYCVPPHTEGEGAHM